MRAVRWKDEYSVGVPELDEQHKHLISVFNRLWRSVSRRLGRHAVAAALTEMVQYMDYHFETEETLMVEAGYPDYASHSAQHRHFAAKTAGFVQDFQDGRILDRELVDFLGEWVVQHISIADKKYEPYLAKERERRAAADEAYRKKVAEQTRK